MKNSTQVATSKVAGLYHILNHINLIFDMHLEP